MELLTAITAISTLILAVITGWYAYITNKILKSSEKSLNEQLRPFVIVHISSVDHFIKLNIKNIGKRSATNVNITFNPDLKEIDKLVANKDAYITHKPMLQQQFLPPDFEINTSIMFTPDYVKDPNLPRIFDVTIKYEDNSGCSYSDNYTLNLSTYIYANKSIEFTDNFYLNEISKELKGIKEELKKILKK